MEVRGGYVTRDAQYVLAKDSSGAPHVIRAKDFVKRAAAAPASAGVPGLRLPARDQRGSTVQSARLTPLPKAPSPAAPLSARSDFGIRSSAVPAPPGTTGPVARRWSGATSPRRRGRRLVAPTVPAIPDGPPDQAAHLLASPTPAPEPEQLPVEWVQVLDVRLAEVLGVECQVLVDAFDGEEGVYEFVRQAGPEAGAALTEVLAETNRRLKDLVAQAQAARFDQRVWRRLNASPSNPPKAKPRARTSPSSSALSLPNLSHAEAAALPREQRRLRERYLAMEEQARVIFSHVQHLERVNAQFTEELQKASDQDKWRKRERELVRRMRVLDYRLSRLYAQREKLAAARRDRMPSEEAVARKEVALRRQVRAVKRRWEEGRRCVKEMREQASEGKEQLSDLHKRWKKLSADLDVCKRGGVIDVPLSQVREDIEEERSRLQREVAVREKYHAHVLARMQLDADEKAEEVREARTQVEQAKSELAAKRRAKRQAKQAVGSWEALQSALTRPHAAEGSTGEAGAGHEEGDQGGLRQLPSTRQLLALTARSEYQSGGVSMRQLVWGSKNAGGAGAGAGASEPPGPGVGRKGSNAKLGGLVAAWGLGNANGATSAAAGDAAEPSRVGKSSLTGVLFQKQTVQAMRQVGDSGRELQLAEGEVDEYVDVDDDMASSVSDGEIPLV